MFLADGTDIAASVAAVNVESIAVKWASSTHDSADIGGNSNPQPDAYLVLTTPQDVIVGISAVNDAKWVANGTSTFAFTDVVISPNAQYYFYFATDVSGLAVGAVMPSANKKNGRVLCAWHGSGHDADETVRIGASNQYSINCSFVVSEASASTLTTASEAVNLSTGTDPVVVTGAVADGVVNVASGATVPALTVVGQATTLKLADSLTATYLYLPATTTIDASDVSFALPSGDATTAETVLVSGKISSASNPAVTLPTLAEGYSFEPLVRDDTGIKAIVSKPVDASVTLDGTEQKWSEVKPEGWINSAVPVINIDNSVAGTLIFDEDVQAAKINITANYPVTFVRGDSVNVDIPYLASPSYNLRAIFTNFVSIPQTAHNTDSGDQITANGTTTLTSFPQIDASAQSAKLIIAQPATFSDRGIYVTGSKIIDINSGATISTTRLVLGNNGSTTQTVTQNGGTITITGTAGAGSTSASVLLGHWNSTSTLKTLGGTFTANNATSRLGWDGTTTWQIGGGESAATVNLYGLVNGQNGHTGSGTLNIMANGTLNLGTGGIQFSNSGNGGNINLAGGTIDTGAAAVTIANAKNGGTILNQNKTTVFNVDANRTLTVDAVVSGEGVGTLDKTGAGKLVLAKTATAKGKLKVTAGTVEFNEGISWGSNGTVEIGQNGTLNVLTSEPVAEGGLLVAGAFTVNGSVLTNGTAAAVEVRSNGIYIDDPNEITVTVPAIANTTVTVMIGEDTIGTAAGEYSVPNDSVVKVVYEPADGYAISGTLEYTIDTSKSETTFDPTETTQVRLCVAYVVFQQEVGLSYEDVTNYYTTVSNAIEAASALKKAVYLVATPDAADTYNISVGETVRIAKGGFTYEGIVFPQGAEFNNTTIETGGITLYSCALYTAIITYADSTQEASSVPLGQLLFTLWQTYTPAKAGLVVRSLDGSDAALADDQAIGTLYTYNSEAHTFTLKPMVASVSFEQGGVQQTQYVPDFALVLQSAMQYDVTATLLVDLDMSSWGSGMTIPGSVEYNEQMVDLHDITLNLGGKTITGPADGYALVNAGADITITGDGAVEGAGIVSNATSTATTTISGGTYTATGDLFAAEEGSTIAVSGGTFNKTVDDEYIADGYEVKDNGDGTYGIREDMGWIYSAPGAWEYTGTWEGATLGDEKVTIETNATYTASAPSANDLVTLNMTLCFDDANDDDIDLSDVKGAVRLGKDGDNYVFQLATTGTVNEVASSVWANASCDTDALAGTDYKFLFVLNLSTKTYTASVIVGTTTNALSVAGSTTIAFANYNKGAAAPVQELAFIGSGSVSSLTGSYEDPPAPPEFVENEEVALSGGNKTLTAGEAAWLNACGDKATVGTAIAGLTLAQFNNAYLLNLDVTAGTFTYTFNVSDIDVSDDSVEVKVTLTRTGALLENEVALPINGTLTLYGTAAIGTDFAEIGSEALDFDADADFGDGKTETTVTVDTSETDAKFYKAVIKRE